MWPRVSNVCTFSTKPFTTQTRARASSLTCVLVLVEVVLGTTVLDTIAGDEAARTVKRIGFLTHQYMAIIRGMRAMRIVS